MERGGQRLLAIGAGLVLGYLALTRTVKPLAVDPNRVARYLNRLLISIGQVRFYRGNLEVLMQISNPNPEIFNVQSLVGKVFLDNQYIGNVAAYSKVIQPTSNNTMILGVQLLPAIVPVVLYRLANNQVKGAAVNFEGNATINGQVLAIKESFRI